MAASASGLFLDFGIIMLVAGAIALLFYYLKQPVVLGYLLAGFFLGPFSFGPSFVGDAEVMAFFGELGIVFLLFALGLEFNLRKLRKVGAVAIIAGTIEIALMLALGYGIGQSIGWTPIQSIFLGAIMSISSTTVIVKVLSEMGNKDEDWAQTAFGILIIEDVLAVLILTALSGAVSSVIFQPEQLVPLLGKLGVFLGAALLLGLLAAPRIVDRLAILRVEEVTVILAVGIGFGMAILAGSLGFSAGLGAFVAGALMAESHRVERITHKVTPLRDVFTAIFFVTVGAALDPRALLDNAGVVVLVTLGVVVGKVAAVTFATFVTGAPPGKALRVGMTLAQIGEFAFIIAALGASLGAADPGLYAVAIAVSALSAFMTPYLIRASPRLVARLDRQLPAGLHAYLSAYRAWLARVARSDRASPEWRQIRVNLLTAALSAAVILATFAAGAILTGEMRAWLAARGLAVFGLEWVLVSAAITPFAYMCYRETKEVVIGVARLAVPQRLRGAECTAPERLLRRTFAFVSILLAAGIATVVGSLLVENFLYVLGIAGLGVALGSVVLGRSLSRFHDEVERTIERMTTGSDAPAAATREEAIHMLDHAHAWGAGSRSVTLPDVSGGGGRSIGELRLRELTGASVLSVARRGHAPFSNPGPALRLEAADTILLVGEDESLTRAEEILLGRDLGVSGGATEIPLPARLAGQALGAIPLGDVQVLVVRRAGEARAAEPTLVLAAGDVLVVSGADDAVAAATVALAA